VTGVVQSDLGQAHTSQQSGELVGVLLGVHGCTQLVHHDVPVAAAQHGCWCRTCTSGRPPSGCAALDLTADNDPGFWETYGYHLYGDPWREQRYADD
jgi:hypothetical protein